MKNNIEYCLNCEWIALWRKLLQDYESEKTLCCTHCRCENDEKNDILDEDAFNERNYGKNEKIPVLEWSRWRKRERINKFKESSNVVQGITKIKW